ncbi:MAG TPA: hypothetical protein VHC46_08460 [Thermodesulfobacteriota bacterium]|nr:hypothetical protein [Thermodesulfobacteriota bacterium]
MHVTKCDKCGYEIGMKIDRCVNCGEPVGLKAGGAGNIKKVLFIIAVIYVIRLALRFFGQ